MYAFIRGILHESTPLAIVLDVQGVGYRIMIPASAFSHLPPLGETMLLHTSYIIREFAHTLYGFLSPHEKEIFELLMEVSGVGPKLALSIIGNLSSHDLLNAIQRGDIKTISKVPGIGKKTAERLVMELRDKLSKIQAVFPEDFIMQTSMDPQAHIVKDAMSALVHLGYHQLAAQSAIKKSLQEMPKEVELSSLITHSLKHLQ